MPDLSLKLDLTGAAPLPQLHLPPLQTQPQDAALPVIQSLAPLQDTIAAWHRHPHQRGKVIIRFNNNFGAIISEYRLLAGVYEVAPLRFHGPEADDYEFYFRSHVADLTWCSHHVDLVLVCEQIALLPPPAA